MPSFSNGPMPSVGALARALGGDVVGRNQINMPGPGHSPRDRSLTVWFGSEHREGFKVLDRANPDRWREGRDHVRVLLQLPEDGWRDHERKAGNVTRLPGNVQTSEDKARIAARIFSEAKPIHGTAAEVYLKDVRRLDLPPEVDDLIRFHPRGLWRDDQNAPWQHVPLMITAVRDITTNAVRAVQKLHLTTTGQKAGKNCRQFYGPLVNAVMKVSPDDAVTMGLHLTEGLESALACLKLGLAPAWAAGDAGKVGIFPLVPGIEVLNIMAEPGDASENAVKKVSARWLDAGREVRVLMPRRGSDAADVVSAQAEAA